MLDIEPSPTPLDRDTFNKHFDNLLNTGQLNPDILPMMDAWQMHAVNEVKKAFKRIKSRTQEFIPEDKYTK
jgi:hypothetical protein